MKNLHYETFRDYMTGSYSAVLTWSASSDDGRRHLTSIAFVGQARMAGGSQREFNADGINDVLVSLGLKGGTGML